MVVANCSGIPFARPHTTRGKPTPLCPLSLSLSFCLSVSPSIRLSVYPSLRLSDSLSLCLSLSLPLHSTWLGLAYLSQVRITVTCEHACGFIHAYVPSHAMPRWRAPLYPNIRVCDGFLSSSAPNTKGSRAGNSDAGDW